MQTFPVGYTDRIHGFQGRFRKIITKAELKALLGRSASVCEDDRRRRRPSGLSRREAAQARMRREEAAEWEARREQEEEAQRQDYIARGGTAVDYIKSKIAEGEEMPFDLDWETMREMAHDRAEGRFAARAKDEKYGYGKLTAKPPMKLTAVDPAKFKNYDGNHERILDARKSVIEAGGKTVNGLLTIDMDGRSVIVSADGIKHRGKKPNRENDMLYPILGPVLKNAVPINELAPREQDKAKRIVNTHVYLGAFGYGNEVCPVRIQVSEKNGRSKIEAIEVLKSLNTKIGRFTSPAGADFGLSEKQNPVKNLPEISIADLIEIAQPLHPEIFSPKICVMRKLPGGERRIVVETTCATTKEGFSEVFAKFGRTWPVAFETGTHCRRMDKCFKTLGFKTVIANPSLVPSITESSKKNDRNDARGLARLAIADLATLHPAFLREETFQQTLRFHHARNTPISRRTQTINQIRGFAKPLGHRIECSSAEKFHEPSKADWPKDLEESAWPLMDSLETINPKIKAYDSQIRNPAEQPEFKEMVDRVRVVYGVGIIGPTVFIAAIGGRPDRFGHSRDVGAHLGMTPRRDQSGDVDKRLHITHAGSDIVRTALVECAGVAPMSNAKDADLKLKGLRIALRGGKIAKKRAKIAVARSMAVAMLALLQHPGREYIPLSEEGKKGFERCRAEMEYLTMEKAARKDRKSDKAA